MARINILTSVLISLLSVSAAAATVSFDALAYDGTGAREGTFFAPYQYTESGYSFYAGGYNHYYESSPVRIWGRQSPYNADPGGATLSFAGNYYDNVQVDRADGALFDFKSVKLTDFYNTGSASYLYVDGVDKNNVHHIVDVDIPAKSPGLSEVNIGLDDLRYFTLSNGNYSSSSVSSFQADDFDLQSEADITMARIMKNSVNVGYSGENIYATFTPTGTTISGAAALLGYTNFNWQQTLIRSDGPVPVVAINPALNPVVPPFSDPIAGGFTYNDYDAYPFYYKNGSISQDILNNQTMGFHDSPGNPCFGYLGLLRSDCGYVKQPDGSAWYFQTQLVGVRADGSYDPLFSFSWKTNYNGTFGGGVVVLGGSSLLPDPGGTGGVTILSQHYIAAVPEAASWIMLIAGFFGAGLMLRRQTAVSAAR